MVGVIVEDLNDLGLHVGSVEEDAFISDGTVQWEAKRSLVGVKLAMDSTVRVCTS